MNFALVNEFTGLYVWVIPGRDQPDSFGKTVYYHQQGIILFSSREGQVRDEV
jgi:hypothetical protein